MRAMRRPVLLPCPSPSRSWPVRARRAGTTGATTETTVARVDGSAFGADDPSPLRLRVVRTPHRRRRRAPGAAGGVNLNTLADYGQANPDLDPNIAYDEGEFAEMATLGFDVVRLLSWSRLEPEPGEIDADYLAQVHDAVDAAADQGLYTVPRRPPGRLFQVRGQPRGHDAPRRPVPGRGWDGAPEWATLTDGARPAPRTPAARAPAPWSPPGTTSGRTPTASRTTSSTCGSASARSSAPTPPSPATTCSTSRASARGRRHQRCASASSTAAPIGRSDGEATAGADVPTSSSSSPSSSGRAWATPRPHRLHPTIPTSCSRRTLRRVDLGPHRHHRRGAGTTPRPGPRPRQHVLGGRVRLVRRPRRAGRPLVQEYGRREDRHLVGGAWWQWRQARGDPTRGATRLATSRPDVLVHLHRTSCPDGEDLGLTQPWATTPPAPIPAPRPVG